MFDSPFSLSQVFSLSSSSLLFSFLFSCLNQRNVAREKSVEWRREGVGEGLEMRTMKGTKGGHDWLKGGGGCLGMER